MGIFLNWKKYNTESHRVQFLVLRPLLYLIYINDLSKSASDKCSPILFVDDKRFIIANCNETEFNLVPIKYLMK